MPSEAQMARFMYYIVKQLDVRSVDWNLVASDMEITNGHAARMRFARFKNQMEGTVPKARAPRDKTRPPKAKRAKTKEEKKEEGEGEGGEKALLRLKVEEAAGGTGGAHTRGGRVEAARPPTPVVKPEPADEAVLLADVDAPGEPVDENELQHHNAHMTPTPTQASQDPHDSAPQHHDLLTPTSHPSPYLLPDQRRPSLAFSSPAPSFSFSHDHELMADSIFLHSMDGAMGQDLQASSGFFDPFMLAHHQHHQHQHQHQHQQMLVDGHGGLVKGEGEWDGSFC